MAIEGFDYKEQVIGTGDTNQYTFDFPIFEDTDLLIYVQDDTGAIVETIRGDDTTFLAGVTFDTVNGGGTVTLVANLTSAYVMTMFLANDTPDQTTSFPNARSFTFAAIEGALDYIAAWGQRAAYLAQRSVKLHDLDDIDGFNPVLPFGISENPNAVLSVSADGTEWEFSITTAEIALAEGYATEAAASAATSTSEATAAAASATAAALSAEEAATSAAGGYTVVPTGPTPTEDPVTVAAAVAIAVVPNTQRELLFISSGSAGAIIMSANPQIAAPTVIGMELVIVGCDGTNSVKLVDGNGLDLQGDIILGDSDVLSLFWNGVDWQESSRRSAT